MSTSRDRARWRVPTDGFWVNQIYVRGLDRDLGLLYIALRYFSFSAIVLKNA